MAGERVEACDQLEFDVVEVADTMGWQLPLVKRGLRQLQWSTGKGLAESNNWTKRHFFLLKNVQLRFKNRVRTLVIPESQTIQPAP